MLRRFASGWTLALALLVLNLVGLAWIRNEVLAVERGGVRVRAVLPERDLRAAENLVVLFDRDVVAAETVGEPLAEPPLRLTPSAAGRWVWTSPDRLEFELAEPLAPGRRFVIEPDAFLARTGWRLVGDERFELSTGGLEVEELRLSSREKNAATLVLEFDQPVHSADLAAALTVEALIADRASVTSVVTQVLTPGDHREHRVRVEFSSAHALRVRLAADLTGPGAHLGLERPFQGQIELPPRLSWLNSRVDEIHDSTNGGRRRIRLRFSEVLAAEQEIPALELTPAVEDFSASIQGSELRLEGSFEPGRRYRIRVSESLLARGGRTLGTTASVYIDVPHLRPRVRFAESRGVLSPAGNLALDLSLTNVPGVRVVAHRLHASNVVAHVRGEGSRATSREAFTRNLALDLRPDERETVGLDLGAMLGEEPLGVWRLDLQASDGRWVRDDAIVRVSDLALTARIERGGYRVWVTSIAAGTPLEGVAVEARTYNDQLLVAGTTDADGLVRLAIPEELPDGDAFLLLASRGADLNWVRPDQRRRVADGVDVSGRATPEGLDAFLYPDRDVVRPGETVHLSGVVRDDEGGTPGAGEGLLVVTRPDGRVAHEHAVDLARAPEGLFHVDVETDTAAPTGRHRVALKVDGREIGSTSFLLEAFVPARIAVEASVPERVGPGEVATIEVAARYLHGGPADGLALRVTPTWTPGARTFTNRAPLTFARVETPRAPRTAAIEARLDDAGRATVAVPAPGGLPLDLWTLRLVATVTEDGGRSVSTAARTAVDTAGRHLGLALERGSREVPTQTELDLEWGWVDGAGELVDGPEAELRVLRVVRETRVAEVGGRRRWITEEIVTEVERRTLVAGARGLQALAIAEPGRYRLVARVQELPETTLTVFAHAPGGLAEPEREPERVEVAIDAARAVPGESVRVELAAPFAGTALVSLEGVRVRFEAVVALPDGVATIDVPVPFDVRGDLYVSVTAVRPLGAGLADWQPHRAHGLARLPVDLGARRAAVALEVPGRARPGDDVTVAVATDLPAGARVHVWAVDEGIVLSGADRLPDPHVAFLGPRRHEIATVDVYGELLPDHARPEGTRRIGGDADGMGRRRGPVPVERRAPALVWREALAVDGSGRAQFACRLPDLRGALRWRAVAVGGDRYGAVEATSTVAMPLFAEAAWPRALAPGDELELAVRVTNAGATPVVARLAFEVAGPLEIDPLGEVEVPPGTTTLFTRARATGLGSARVELAVEGTVAGELVVDRTRAAVAIRRGAPLHARTTARRVNAGETLTLDLGDGFEPEGRRVRVRVAARPEVELEPALTRVLRYPHGCVEQTASVLAGLLAVPGLVGDASPVEDLVQAGIDRLWSMQTTGGGLSYWPGGSAPDAFGSAYAARRLVAARERGHDVPPALIDGLLGYLEEELSRLREPNLQTIFTRALAEAQRPALGWMERLDERRDELDAAGRAHLAAAWLAAGRRDRAEALCDEGLLGRVASLSVEGRLTSPVRQRALVLDLLLRLDDEDPRVDELVRGLHGARVDGSWANTLANASAIEALARYAALRESPASYRGELVLDGERIAFDEDTPLELVRTDPAGALALESTGAGSFSVVTTVEGFALDPEAVAADRGIRARRRLVDRHGAPLAGSIAVGDLVFVEVEVASLEPDAYHARVAVVDVLPGGFEVENPRLATSAPWPAASRVFQPERIEFLDDRVVFFLTVAPDSRTVRYALRAVAAGTFAVPPLQASSMYDPGVSSIHGAGGIEVAR